MPHLAKYSLLQPLKTPHSPSFSCSILHIFGHGVIRVTLQLTQVPLLPGALSLVITHRIEAFAVKIPLNTIILLLSFDERNGVVDGLLLVILVKVEVSEALLIVVGSDGGLAIDLEVHIVAFQAHH